MTTTPLRKLPPVEAADDIESPTCVPEVEVLRVMVVHDAPRREGRVAVVERPDHRRRVVGDRVGHGVRREAELGALDEPAVEEVGGGRTRARDLVVRGLLHARRENEGGENMSQKASPPNVAVCWRNC